MSKRRGYVPLAATGFPCRKLSLVGLSHLLEKTLSGCSLLLLALDAGLFIMLALSHFGKNASLFDLLLETTQSEIKVVVIEKNSGHENHLLPCHCRLLPR